MSLGEYKMITSGRGGFASPALMEKFLNDLGKEDWEIVSFQMQPDNILAFNGLARRTTQRDWTLQDAVAAAAKVEALSSNGMDEIEIPAFLRKQAD
jgi:hypothetical protein